MRRNLAPGWMMRLTSTVCRNKGVGVGGTHGDMKGRPSKVTLGKAGKCAERRTRRRLSAAPSQS